MVEPHAFPYKVSAFICILMNYKIFLKNQSHILNKNNHRKKIITPSILFKNKNKIK